MTVSPEMHKMQREIAYENNIYINKKRFDIYFVKSSWKQKQTLKKIRNSKFLNYPKISYHFIGLVFIDRQ